MADDHYAKEEFDSYEEMLAWVEAKEAKGTRETVDGIDVDARLAAQAAVYLGIGYLVARGADDLLGGL